MKHRSLLKPIRLPFVLLTVVSAGLLPGCGQSKPETAAAPGAAATAKKTCEGDAGIAQDRRLPGLAVRGGRR